MKNFLFFAVLTFVLCSCSVVPVTVGLPWYRSLSEENIPAGSVISIAVQSQSTPLLGSESLVEKEIADKAASLLTRRGYVIADQNYQYKLNIYYKTQQQPKNNTSYSSYNMTSASSASFSAAGLYGRGYGVNLAQSIAASSIKNVSATNVSTFNYDLYYHTIACEFSNLDNRIVWKYDTTTETINKDVLRVYAPLLQIAFSGLPSVRNVYPRVPYLNPARFNDFSSIYIQGNYYRCPALPNLIKFKINLSSNDTYSSSTIGKQVLSIKHKDATLAYLDLLETAEYAIPDCNEKLWANPQNRSIWKKVVLIGKYYLGNDPKPVNIIIDLLGTSDSYVVAKCRVADEAEYTYYQAKYNRWVQKLTEFYSFVQDDRPTKE